MTASELESELSALSRAEKARLLQLLAQDISNTWPGVMVGEAMKALTIS
jgi:hypothetical protein